MSGTAQVFLFTGPETGEKDDAIGALKAAALKRNGTLELHKYYAADTRAEDVVSLLRNASLFSPALFVILRGAELLRAKSDIDLLVSWIRASSGSPNTLVLTSEETSVDKRLESAIPDGQKRIFWEMFESRKPQWVESFFRKNGYSITTGAVDAILEMVENNTESLRNECSRFFYCFEKGAVISEDDVENLLSHNKEESAFTLFDAMADSSKSPAQRLEASLDILQKIRSTKDSNSVALIAGLSYCFRQLGLWHSLHAASQSVSEETLRAKGFYSKRNREKYGRAARVWRAGDAHSALSLLSHTDMSIRKTGAAFEETLLVMLIYSIVMKSGHSCAEYE